MSTAGPQCAPRTAKKPVGAPCHEVQTAHRLTLASFFPLPSPLPLPAPSACADLAEILAKKTHPRTKVNTYYIHYIGCTLLASPHPRLPSRQLNPLPPSPTPALRPQPTSPAATVNKRLDDWVAENRIDFSKLQPPEVEEKKV